MTGPTPEDLRRHGRLLDDAADATADVVAGLAEAWADMTGRGWAERLRRVGHHLDDLATDLFDRADATDRGTAEAPVGVRLGAQTGERTTARRGMVVPTLPPP